MNRRDFIKQVSGVVALGGGLYLSDSPADASTVRDISLGGRAGTWRLETPRRLSDITHHLAQRALAGEHGRSMARATFHLDEHDTEGLSPDMRYAMACKLVAERAPLRILPGERIAGSATLLEAPAHQTPVAGVPSVSHTTLGFDRVLKSGYKGLRQAIEARLARGGFETRNDWADKTAPGRSGGTSRALRTGPHWWEARSRDEYGHPPLTVECWAKVHSKNGFNVLVLNGSKESRRHWEIYSYAGTGVFSAYLPGYAPAEVRSNRDITDGLWHYLAMTFDGSRVGLYVDGDSVADASVQPIVALEDKRNPLYFGMYPPGGIGCDGAVDEIRLSSVIRDIRGVPKTALEADAATIGLWRIAENGDLGDSSALRNPGILVASRQGADLLQSMLVCLDAAALWHRRHMDKLEELAAASTGEEHENYVKVLGALKNVPENPPATFCEAVQSLWFMYAFQRLMGTWSGIGRIDEMLGPYLERDLAEGRITMDEARELLAHFWIKGCEWIGAFNTQGSGDAQHYQNILLSGIDAQGQDITNHVTYLVLDVVEELHISDFPIAVRVNRKTPKRLLRRVAEVQRHGGGIVALYNEEVVIAGLIKFGYSLEEARCFANDGCWEAIIPGKTTFSYVPFDSLVLLHDALGVLDTTQAPPDYATFDDLYAAYLERLRAQVDGHHRIADGWAKNGHPTPLVSMFIDDCIENGRSYFDRGARYCVLAAHAGRLANVANSLLAIKHLVYEEQFLSLPEFVEILRNDWKDQENLRRLIQNRFAFYGNDDDDADAMMARVFNDYTGIVWEIPEREGVKRPAGISTFGREIEYSQNERCRRASADGHHAGAVLATNCSPSPGTDKKGPTAVIKSYCKLDFTRSPNGATVELKIHPESVRGDAGRDAMVALMRGFVNLGGWFMHVDVVDSAMLLDAQRHPEKYPNLSVRIAGWSARFATLNKDWQDMVIARTQQFVT